jgi:hypothetical protein
MMSSESVIAAIQVVPDARLDDNDDFTGVAEVAVLGPTLTVMTCFIPGQWPVGVGASASNKS